MWVIYTALIIVGAAACFVWGFACYKLYRWVTPKKPTLINPYISAHVLKERNDDAYEEYQDWYKAHGRGVPIPKVKTPEDIEAEKKISKLF